MLKQMGITADNLEPGVEFEDVIGFLTGSVACFKKRWNGTIYLKITQSGMRNNNNCSKRIKYHTCVR